MANARNRKHGDASSATSEIDSLPLNHGHSHGSSTTTKLIGLSIIAFIVCFRTVLSSSSKEIHEHEHDASLEGEGKGKVADHEANADMNVAEDSNHPWHWVNLQNRLEGKDVDFVTNSLLDYSSDKTSYDSPKQFLTACQNGELDEGKCDFLGGPTDKFSKMGPHVLEVLVELGMKNTSKVLEVGAGLSRVSKHIIDFVDEGNYGGIEPNGDMLAVGTAHIIGRDTLLNKKPRYSTNLDFDFGVFREKFDVVTSRSVWTHTSKVQIEKYLSSFANNAAQGAFLATSVVKVTEDCSKDYMGTEWVGKSNDSNGEGIVLHCMPWLRTACEKEGLMVESLKEVAPKLVGQNSWSDLGQPWIVIRKTKTS